MGALIHCVLCVWRHGNVCFAAASASSATVFGNVLELTEVAREINY